MLFGLSIAHSVFRDIILQKKDAVTYLTSAVTASSTMLL